MACAACPQPGRSAGAHHGFTLIELLVALAVAALLAGVALPSFADHWRQARRSDAVVALTRLQMAQEQYRAAHGLYAPTLAALRLGVLPHSDQGFYDISLEAVQPHQYRAVAAARADGSQSGDAACLRITLDVTDGIVDNGPEARCWNR